MFNNFTNAPLVSNIICRKSYRELKVRRLIRILYKFGKLISCYDKKQVLLVSPMLGCRHSLLRCSNISCFYQVECTFSNISTCEHLPVGGHYLVFLALSIKVVLQAHIFVDHL